VAIACGERRGVVHLNAPFRPPLEPTAVPGDVTDAPVLEPLVQIPAPAPREPSTEQIATCAALVKTFARGVIVCGPACAGDGFRERVLDLAEATGYPILADALSGVRFGPDRAGVLLSGAYETYLHPHSTIGKALPKPELVLRFGAVPTSKWLNQFLDEAKARAVMQVSADGVWADDSHRVTHLVQADPAGFAHALAQACAGVAQRASEMHAYWAAERAAAGAWQHALNSGAWYDAVAVHDVIDLLPEGATLFAGNSLPVRHVDQFGSTAGKRLSVHANRGASGIDGNISTALGIGHARPAQVLAAVLGDVTLYHDMNGLLAVKRSGVPITLVLLNNNGGGIFRRLAVKDFDPPFTEYFATPHGLNFEPVAQLYGLGYVRARDRAHFRESFAASVRAGASTLIEVATDAQADFDARAALIRAVSATLG
jgi:2-succinyl-5-enolpyruvyl-6-hydroxy-3-cyclohexene-1-carboxylate synthase